MSAVPALPWCENCQSEVEAETNESNGFTCVPAPSPPAPRRDTQLSSAHPRVPVPDRTFARSLAARRP